MAISWLEFRFLCLARQNGLFVPGGSVLEFGEAETNNLDVPAALEMAMPEGFDRDTTIEMARRLLAEGGGFELAKIIYRAFLDYSSYTAIDLEPGPNRIQQDLNQPFDLGSRYDICINNGTSEHIFNQANIFKAIHDHTKVGGLMLHWTPCLGWTDHGLFNAQPGLFYDLAHANDYEVCLAVLMTKKNNFHMVPLMNISALREKYTDLWNAEACVVMRRKSSEPFRYPLQGVYRTLDKFAASSVVT